MADLLLVFSGSKLAGSPLAPAAFSPSDQALAAFWEHCQEVLLRPAEVSGRASPLPCLCCGCVCVCVWKRASVCVLGDQPPSCPGKCVVWASWLLPGLISAPFN
jgi:hypothetical protein